MQGNKQDILCKEEVLDLTGDSDDEFVKQEVSAHKLIDGFDNNFTMLSENEKEENLSSSPVEEKAHCTASQRCKSIRRFDQSLEQAIIAIKKGGSLDATAMKFGIPKDVIYNKLISRSLPREMDILTSAEELNLVKWILRANKKNTIVLKNNLLVKVGNMKKVADITPIFAKSKFGKMWYDYFVRRYPEIYENDGILFPSDVGFESSSDSSSSQQCLSKSDSEENKLVEWILEMNRQNKLVFKYDLLEKVRKLRKFLPMFIKSQENKWYKEFLNKHKEIYENEELLMPSTTRNPRNNMSKQETHSPPEPFPRGPLKIEQDIAKQLHILGFKEALVVLHDFKHENLHIQSLPKKELRSVLLETKKMCITESRSRLNQIELNQKAIKDDIKIEKLLGSEGSVLEEERSSNENERTFTNQEKSSGNINVFGENLCVKTENCRKNKHMERGAKEADPQLMCTKCNKTFCNRSKLARHLTLHIPKEQHEFQCDVCLKRFSSKYHLSVHIKLAHSDNVYHCDECNSVFKHSTSLRKHKRTIHLDIMGENIKLRSFFCDICPKAFKYKKSLKDHIIYMHLQNKKKYPCSICKKRFIKYSLMLRHKLRHVKTKPFACNNCTKTFSRKYLLRGHSHQCNINHGSESMLEEEDCKTLSIDHLEKLDVD